MRAAAAVSFKKVSQALHADPQSPCAVLLGDPAVRGVLRKTLGGGDAPEAGGVWGEALDGICIVDVPDPQTAEAATELATFLRGLQRTNAFVLACDESEENIPIETLMLLTGFYGISMPWPHLAIVTPASASKGTEPSKREVALRRRLRCDSATFTTGKVKPPGKLSVFLLGGPTDSAKNSKQPDEKGRLKTFLKTCKPLKCDPSQSMSPLLTQYRSITEKLHSQRTALASPRRLPSHGQRFLKVSKNKSPKSLEDGYLPQLSTNGARSGMNMRMKPRSSSEGGSLHYSDATTQWYTDSSNSSHANPEILPPLHGHTSPGPGPLWAQPSGGPVGSARFGGGLYVGMDRQDGMYRSASDGYLTPPNSRRYGGQEVSRHQFHFGVGASRQPPMLHPMHMRNVGNLPHLSTAHQRFACSESQSSGYDRFRPHGYGWSDSGYERQQWQPKPQFSQSYHDQPWYDNQWTGWRGAGWSSNDNWHGNWWNDESWQTGQQPEQQQQEDKPSETAPGPKDKSTKGKSKPATESRATPAEAEEQGQLQSTGNRAAPDSSQVTGNAASEWDLLRQEAASP